MRHEAADIIQDHPEDTAEWKAKARLAGTAAVDATKAAYQTIQEKTKACARSTDQAVRENPYISMGIAFGVGALLGFLLTNRRGKAEED